MENTKTIRNPFPWIGKVFKYEMKHSSRILMPVYIAIVAIALITGLFVPLESRTRTLVLKNSSIHPLPS